MTAVTDRARRLRSALGRRLRPVDLHTGAASPDRRAAALREATGRLSDGSAGEAERTAAARLVRAYLADLPARQPGKQMQAAVAAAFVGLYQPREQSADPPHPVVQQAIVEQFHRLYYHVSDRTWLDTSYRGISTYKCPLDMWVYADLVHRLRPGLVVETGTWRGGSALFIAHQLDLNDLGEVVSVDVKEQPSRPTHPRLTYLTGSSTDPVVLDQVRARLPADEPVIVLLDSDHSQQHVLAELRAYAPMVPLGSYLIVEDTNVNGHPAAPDHGPGPFEAVQEFLAGDPGFEPDRRCERYFLTQNPSGYLRRVTAA